jgi:hypothetical protein
MRAMLWAIAWTVGASGLEEELVRAMRQKARTQLVLRETEDRSSALWP